MKTLGKAIAVASLAAVSTQAVAVEGLSTTIGVVSDYYFRGANLGDAGGYVSLDFEKGGFNIGVWAIDDGASSYDAVEDESSNGNDGLETDFYVGYGVDLDGIELGIGYTRYEYTYTSDFEHEINLSVAASGFGLAVAVGTDEDEEDSATEDEADYTVIELTYESGPYGVKLGSYDLDEGDDDFISETEYKWAEVSYSAEVGTFDVVATVGQQFDVEVDGSDVSSEGRNYITFDVSKGFDI